MPNSATFFPLEPETELMNCQIQNKTSNSSIVNYFRSPDIEAVTYFSDGNTLNATLWLSDMFKEPPLAASNWLSPLKPENIFLHNMRYGISIDVKSAYDIEQEVDYNSYVDWDPYNNSKMKTNWEKIVIERFSNKETRTLEEQTNYTGFFDREKKYVDLSFDIDTIKSADQYNLVFYIVDIFINKDGRLCRLGDMSNRVYVPPPNFNITTLPTSAELRAGQGSRNIEVQIKPTTDIESQAFFYTNYTGNSNQLNLTFSPNITSIPSNSMGTSVLNIKASNDATLRSYTIPIFANISIPTEAKALSIGGAGEIFSNSKSANLIESSTITINVKEPLPWYEPIRSFLTDWSTSLFAIPTAIVSIISGVLGWRIGEKQKKNKDKQSRNNRGTWE
jgi:hypothetical protein